MAWRARVASVAVVLGTLATPAQAQEMWIVNVVGLGGDPEYTERFMGWARELEEHLTTRWNVPTERVITLGEDATAPDVDGESRRENIEATIARIASDAAPTARVLFVLIGHGSFRNDEASLNIPGQDLSAAEWNVALEPLGERTVAVVNVASSSGPFTEALAATGRTVITATRSGQERNETQFGRYFAEAFGGDAADLDKDGRLSLLEAFVYARSETARYYAEEGLLSTEHAQIDDDGDGEAIDVPVDGSTDGAVASTFRFTSASTAAAPGALPSDSTSVRIEAEIAEIEADLAILRSRRDEMTQEEYDVALEALLVELALKNRELRGRSGGGG
jgi:hypothetical protein